MIPPIENSSDDSKALLAICPARREQEVYVTCHALQALDFSFQLCGLRIGIRTGHVRIAFIGRTENAKTFGDFCIDRVGRSTDQRIDKFITAAQTKAADTITTRVFDVVRALDAAPVKNSGGPSGFRCANE